MKKYLIIGVLSIVVNSATAVNVTFIGSTKKVIEIPAEKATGLEMIYVAYDSGEITEMVIPVQSNNIKVYRYSNLGGGFAEEIPFTLVNNEVKIGSPAGNYGYIIEEDGRNTCFWVVNYLPSALRLEGVTELDVQDCDNTQLTISGNGGSIYYFTIDGRQAELSREITLNYYNLQWNSDSEQFSQYEATKEIAHLNNPVILTPPLYCNSQITVTGDRFLKEWGISQHIVSHNIKANGIAVETSAEQTNLNENEDDEPSNMIKAETQGMGGSAPADFSFTAFITDEVIHKEWQIADDPDFEYINYRFNEQNLDYTFNEEGNYYVRFIGSNADGSCEAIGESYEITIGASELRIPNAFTPNDDGINDVWKVGYRSLLNFRCSIFDRYGNEIYSFSDPTGGWDGKYKGKLVKPGVYFYVIEAQGADGKKYKKGGDINILKSKRNSTQGN